MKHPNSVAFAIVAALLVYPSMTGCASVSPGNDALVVNAERSIEISFEAVNAFVEAENDNRDIIIRDLPDVHAFAETVRKGGPKAFTDARDAVRTYKRTRLPEDGDVINNRIAQVQTLARLARQYMLRLPAR